MKVDSYAVGMTSSSLSTQMYTATEKLVVGQEGGGAASGNQYVATVTFSPEAREQSASQKGNAAVQGAKKPYEYGLTDKESMKIYMLERFLESITGKKYNFRMFDKFRAGNNNNNNVLSGAKQIIQVPRISIERTETYRETQQMSFEAAGVVNTSDGRQIRFDLNVSASYEFSSSSTVAAAVKGAKLCDPLVINFDGALPEFTKDRYAFDITIDGLADNIFMPTNGSGFLALDKDGNGKIDDGSELFGASSGDGFWELSAYDGDGNGWIDEGDEVFSKLKIMSVDKDTGEFVLVSLKDSGVGAIYLGSANCNYEIKGDGNELMGVVRKNGVFLNENGSAGTIHHIDLTY